jgi:hypothetical protein
MFELEKLHSVLLPPLTGAVGFAFIVKRQQFDSDSTQVEAVFTASAYKFWFLLYSK